MTDSQEFVATAKAGPRDHEHAHHNRPDPAKPPEDMSRWIIKAQPRLDGLPDHKPIERVPYFATAPSRVEVPKAIEMGAWISTEKATEKAPWEGKRRTAETACRDFERRLQVVRKQYSQHPTRELYDAHELAMRALDGAEIDLEILNEQIKIAFAAIEATDWNARHQSYLDGIARRQQYAEQLRKAEAVAYQLAEIYTALNAAHVDGGETRRRLRDTLVQAFQSHGHHYEALRELIRL